MNSFLNMIGPPRLRESNHVTTEYYVLSIDKKFKGFHALFFASSAKSVGYHGLGKFPKGMVERDLGRSEASKAIGFSDGQF
ncbi:MAG: hypothetical protein ABIH23_35075, partial [bacterium]